MVIYKENLCYLICFRHLIVSRAVTNFAQHGLITVLILDGISLFAQEWLQIGFCSTCSELPSNISTMGLSKTIHNMVLILDGNSL